MTDIGHFYVEVKAEFGGEGERRCRKTVLWKWVGYYIMSNINLMEEV